MNVDLSPTVWAISVYSKIDCFQKNTSMGINGWCCSFTVGNTRLGRYIHKDYTQPIMPESLKLSTRQRQASQIWRCRLIISLTRFLTLWITLKNIPGQQWILPMMLLILLLYPAPGISYMHVMMNLSTDYDWSIGLIKWNGNDTLTYGRIMLRVLSILNTMQ